jgi:hypothetical protein
MVLTDMNALTTKGSFAHYSPPVTTSAPRLPMFWSQGQLCLEKQELAFYDELVRGSMLMVRLRQGGQTP